MVVMNGVETTQIDCYSCSMMFHVPAQWDANRRNDHATFYCPNGHAQSYTGKTAAEKRIEALEKERDNLRKYNESLSKDYQIEYQARKQVQRNLAATKGVLTKTRKRVGNGVCPCCTRSFTNLRRHMETKHPDFSEPPADNAAAEPVT